MFRIGDCPFARRPYGDPEMIKRECVRLLGVLLGVVLISYCGQSAVRAQPAGEPIPTVVDFSRPCLL
jgi:hypothetical protein